MRVSFVVPVHGEAPWLEEVLTAVVDQGEHEVVIVDDGAREEARAVLERWSDHPDLRVLPGSGRGAAAATNAGIRAARNPCIAQIDQDVVLGPDWLAELTRELEDPEVAAAQGTWITDPSAPLWSRVSGLDLEERHHRLFDSSTDHVCTGNTLYRAECLERVGLFDETLGYGYDNDLSYRLQAAGYRVSICRGAKSVHRWPGTLRGYLRQQYGLGYGRLDLIRRHPMRATGDRVSGLRMILQVPAMLAALLAALAGLALHLAEGNPAPLLGISTLFFALLVADRLAAGFSAWRRHRDPAAWLFVPAHLLRDLVWVGALLSWTLRRLLRRPPLPRHSMQPDAAPSPEGKDPDPGTGR